MGVTNAEEAMAFVNELIEKHEVVVFSKTYCPYCDKAKKLLKQLGANAHEVELDEMEEGSLIQEALKTKTKQSSVPNIFINKKHIGGCDDLHALHKAGNLVPLLGK